MKEAGTFDVIFTPKNGGPQQKFNVFDYPNGGGVGLAMYNTEESITEFAHQCFNYALTRNYPLYLTTKNTILKRYDGRFKDIFQNLYDTQYASKFKAQGLWYVFKLINRK